MKSMPAAPAPLSVTGALPGLKALIVALAIAVVVVLVMNLLVVLIPVAIFLVVRWSLLGIVAGIEGAPDRGILRRSAAMARRNWWRVASITLVASLALLIGPAVGVVILILTGAAFDLVNMIAALVYVVSLPAAAVVQTYLYYDLRGRRESEPVVVDGPGTEPLAGTG